MTPLDYSLLPLLDSTSFLVGFVLSLLILSFVIRDSWLVRAAQYLLVGVTLAYTVVLVWVNVLWPRLVLPLLVSLAPGGQGVQSGGDVWALWLLLAAGILLWAAGIDLLRGGRKGQPVTWLRWLAPFPLALLVGVGLGAGIAGAWQGTLFPQWQRASAAGQLLQAEPGLWLTTLLTLTITGGAWLHLYLGGATADHRPYPALLRPLLSGWAWLGERAIWLAAGVIFARLFASRITLLIARLDALFLGAQAREIWQWLAVLWPGG
ncbi:MAG TPA: hypothetical protein PL105_07280 [Caldilineaceae bacterium]|nr:hypothetical protein [Caldilineaceae bacterium]